MSIRRNPVLRMTEPQHRRRPEFVATVDEFRARHADALRPCIGQTIDAIWEAWDLSDDTWFADEAVILEIGGRQLEIVWWKIGEVSLSWNAIDLTQPPNWVADWGDIPLQWRRNAMPEFQAIIGQPVREIRLIEYLSRFSVIEDPDPAMIGRQGELWILFGLEFELASMTCSVFDNGDENGFRFEPLTGPDFRIRTLFDTH